MLLLALDTSTPAVGVALHDGIEVVASTTVIDARRHGELLAPGVEAVLANAGATPRDLTDVVVGVGPGPFTGLRVGIVTARVIAATTGARLHGVCSLDALAHGVDLGGPFLVATDARRKEVYWAAYDVDGSRVAGPAVDRPADLAAAHPDAAVVGPGADLYAELLGPSRGPSTMSPESLAAVALERLTAGEDLGSTEPLYLRRPDAAPPGPRKAAS